LGNWPRIQGYVPEAFERGFRIEDLVIKIEHTMPECLLSSDVVERRTYVTGRAEESQIFPRRAVWYFAKWYSYFGDQK